MKHRTATTGVAALVALPLVPADAFGHTSEQSFVLLLPTKLYISAGIMAVALTVLILAVAPSFTSRRAFATRRLLAIEPPVELKTATSLVSLLLLGTLIGLGFFGSHDPLSNPLPLAIWTVWWMAMLFIQGVAGDIWGWINPWTGLHRLLVRNGRDGLVPALPDWACHSIAITSLLAFHIFAIADPAPDDPKRLAGFVFAYWVFSFIGMLIFGRIVWLEKCECFSVLFSLFARLSPFRLSAGRFEFGLSGWQLVRMERVPTGMALFALIALGTGSFDGLNETFWWLALIGVNPLEFPGRSAVIAETVVGLLAAPILLVAVFGTCTWAGTLLAGSNGTAGKTSFGTAFRRLAVSVLPIALGYHFAHYLTAFMVNIQYTVAAVSDPLHTGADYLGLGNFYVTTGFFNTRDSVRIIWLTQCFAVVAGHVIAVIAAHEIACRIFGTGRQAFLSQLPVSVFMILYTLLSLWLLASPRGA